MWTLCSWQHADKPETIKSKQGSGNQWYPWPWQVKNLGIVMSKERRAGSVTSVIKVHKMPWPRCLVLQENIVPIIKCGEQNEIMSGLFLLSLLAQAERNNMLVTEHGIMEKDVLWRSLGNHSTHIYWAPTRFQGEFWALGRHLQLRYIVLILPFII